MHRFRRTHTLFCYTCLLLLVSSCGVSKSLKDRPDLSQYNAKIQDRIKTSDSTYTIGNNFLTKNQHGLWELYVEGDPLERGLVIGSLTRELNKNKNKYFCRR